MRHHVVQMAEGRDNVFSLEILQETCFALDCLMGADHSSQQEARRMTRSCVHTIAYLHPANITSAKRLLAVLAGLFHHPSNS